MKTKLCLAILVLACPLLWMGCGTESHVVQGPGITTQGLDTKDFVDKAGEMIDSLIGSGKLETAHRKPAVIAVGKIINDTRFQLRMALLTDKVSVALTKGGKAITDVTGLNEPDFTLAGRITQTHKKQDNTREDTYTFSLMLVNSQGLAVWNEETEIKKQTTKPVVSY